MKRVVRWLVGWVIFLPLAITSLFFLAALAPREGGGQAIPGSGLLILPIWCVGLFVFSAIATKVSYWLMNKAEMTEKRKSSMNKP
jgi:hypothetical protein